MPRAVIDDLRKHGVLRDRAVDEEHKLRRVRSEIGWQLCGPSGNLLTLTERAMAVRTAYVGPHRKNRIASPWRVNECKPRTWLIGVAVGLAAGLIQIGFAPRRRCCAQPVGGASLDGNLLNKSAVAAHSVSARC